MSLRAERYMTDIIPSLEEAEIEEEERFISADIQERTEMSAAHVGQTLTFMIDNYDIPIGYEDIDPRSYFVEDFEELNRSRHEIHEIIRENGDMTEEVALEQIKRDLEEECGGQQVDESDLQSYLVKQVDRYENISMFSQRVERANDILEDLRGEVLLQDSEEPELGRVYTVSK